MEPKSGFKTTEFWLALVAQGVAVLTMLGVIAPEVQAEWVEALQLIVGGLISLGTGIAFIVSRTELKKFFIRKQPEVTVETEVRG